MTVSQPAATVRRWLTAGTFAVANFWLVVVLSMGAWALLPVAVGWTPLVITSDSMTPALSTGDILVIDDYDGRPLDIGTVVTYRQAGRLITHRIVDATDDGHVTQGDANPTADSTTLTRDAIEGTGRIVVPLLARPYTDLTAGQPGPALRWGGLTLGALAIASRRPGVGARATSMGVHHRSRDNDISREGERDDPIRGRSRLADETGRPRPVPGSASSFCSSGARVHHLPHPHEHPPARPSAGPTGPGGVWHARMPLTSGPTPPASRTTRPLASLFRTLGVAATGALVLAAGVSGAPFMDTTASPGSWQAQLDPPTDVNADPGCSNDSPYVDLSWIANTSADGYDIHRKVNNGTWSIAHTITDSALEAWRDNDVADGNDYHYRLQAFLDSGSTSDVSNEVSATVGGNLVCL